ncbi:MULTISPECIES: SUKH-4 family immunity protein [Streptomyces]|jgi:hypothetical protein|uniref:SUKH-4 immunity protein of toxin-antitoxin system n=2 Tax=Streptomyces TaxID=1883 RepID=A0ABT9LDD7_STRGD|nr:MULTISPECIES: SUKH-4 family immunity protein [Streptomyces]MDP9681664.1 hypothetical protein [Streptomyces griseoviridis]GGS72944.1 hypothetical protein GCM10010240_02280 [Streptomyces griseoviridis]GGU34454.1 hypothetical protein GCM10010259_26310 [Streptomyces daghestanicus]GHI34339.1 hypothetical protein Sdagh_60690 [Streptomyces daghestanicus]
MESAFDADDLITVDETALGAVTHEPTRVFLREVGLPDRVGWFEADQQLVDGEIEVGGDDWQAVAAKYPSCSFDMSAWLTLGGIGMDDIVIDSATGVVYCIPEEGRIHVLNSSIDAFAYFLRELEMERSAYDHEVAGDAMTDPVGAENRLRATMRRADPTALEDPESLWQAVLRSVGNSLMSY